MSGTLTDPEPVPPKFMYLYIKTISFFYYVGGAVVAYAILEVSGSILKMFV